MADDVINVSEKKDELTTPGLDKVREERDRLISKIDDYCERKANDLGGDETFKNDLKAKIERLVIEDEIVDVKDEVAEIGDILKNNSEVRDDVEAEIESKKIRLEVNKKLVLENIDEVREIREEDFVQKELEKTKELNPDLTKEQTDQVEKVLREVSKVYTGTENQKNVVIDTNSDLSTGQLINSVNESQAVAGLLAKTPKNFNKFKETYKQIREILPFDGSPKLAAFDRVMMSADKLGGVFNQIQGGGWMGKIDKLTGGWLNRTIVETSGKFISKIGNQAARDFLQNSVGVLAKEGFKNGLNTIFKGILSGGVKAAAAGGATGAAAGIAGAAAGAASGPVGWAVLAGTVLLKGLKKGLEKLGIDLNKIKGSLAITGNKFIDGVIGLLGSLVALPALLIGSLSIVVLGPVIIAVFVGLFGYQMMQNNLISSIVPPVEQPLTSEDETATGSGSLNGASCAGGVLNLENIYEPINISKIKTRLSKSEYSYKSNGDINFSCINALLPAKLTHKRSDILKAAYALLGVPYWMGGGHGTIASGVSSDWGKRVSAPSSGWNKGRRYHGLDCSGFVRWVYKYVTGETVGNLAADIYSKSEKISKSELKPGDIGFLKGNDSNHIGLFLGKGTNGKYYFIHDAGRSSGAGPQGLGGVYVSAANFNYFGRIKVNLSD